MKHIWTIICLNTIEDKKTNNASLIEVVDRLVLEGSLPDVRPLNLPFPLPLYVVSNWWRDDDEDRFQYRARMSLISPQGETLKIFETTVNLVDYPRIRATLEMETFPFTGSGIYTLDISHLEENRWIPAASIPLEIVHEQPELETERESEPAS